MVQNNRASDKDGESRPSDCAIPPDRGAVSGKPSRKNRNQRER